MTNSIGSANGSADGSASNNKSNNVRTSSNTTTNNSNSSRNDHPSRDPDHDDDDDAAGEQANNNLRTDEAADDDSSHDSSDNNRDGDSDDGGGSDCDSNGQDNSVCNSINLIDDEVQTDIALHEFFQILQMQKTPTSHTRSTTEKNEHPSQYCVIIPASFEFWNKAVEKGYAFGNLRRLVKANGMISFGSIFAHDEELSIFKAICCINGIFLHLKQNNSWLAPLLRIFFGMLQNGGANGTLAIFSPFVKMFNSGDVPLPKVKTVELDDLDLTNQTKLLRRVAMTARIVCCFECEFGASSHAFQSYLLGTEEECRVESLDMEECDFDCDSLVPILQSNRLTRIGLYDKREFYSSSDLAKIMDTLSKSNLQIIILNVFADHDKWWSQIVSLLQRNTNLVTLDLFDASKPRVGPPRDVMQLVQTAATAPRLSMIRLTPPPAKRWQRMMRRMLRRNELVRNLGCTTLSPHIFGTLICKVSDDPTLVWELLIRSADILKRSWDSGRAKRVAAWRKEIEEDRERLRKKVKRFGEMKRML